MSPQQSSLAFDWPSPAPKVTNGQIGLICIWLHGQGWQTARWLTSRTGLNDRTLRAIAEASGGEILGSVRGYKLLSEATSSEINHCIAALKSQGEKMIARAKAIEIARHRCHDARSA